MLKYCRYQLICLASNIGPKILQSLGPKQKKRQINKKMLKRTVDKVMIKNNLPDNIADNIIEYAKYDNNDENVITEEHFMFQEFVNECKVPDIKHIISTYSEVDNPRMFADDAFDIKKLFNRDIDISVRFILNKARIRHHRQCFIDQGRSTTRLGSKRKAEDNYHYIINKFKRELIRINRPKPIMQAYIHWAFEQLLYDLDYSESDNDENESEIGDSDSDSDSERHKAELERLRAEYLQAPRCIHCTRPLDICACEDIRRMRREMGDIDGDNNSESESE